MMSKPKGKHIKQINKATLADQADKHDLYQQSVQEPEHETDIFDQVFS